MKLHALPLQILLALLGVAAGLQVGRPRLVAAAGALSAGDAALLERLRVAVQVGDGAAVVSLTDELRRPHAAHILGLTSAELSGTEPTADVESKAKAMLKAKTDPKVAAGPLSLAGACVFDDLIFSLTPESKAKLRVQLREDAMQDALRWVRSGGWWFCSAYGRPCMCSGYVRLVSDATGSPVGERSHGGLMCNAQAFAATSLVAGVSEEHPELHCECSSDAFATGAALPDSAADSFHLERRLTSKSILQESWVMLLRLLSRSGLVPLGTGDRTYSGMQNWAARSMGPDLQRQNWGPQSMVVLERFWIEKYIREIAKPNIRGPKCLEWGDPSNPGKYFNYANKVPTCTKKFDMQFDHVYWQKHGKGMKDNVVHSDILGLPEVLGRAHGGLDYNRMDAIFATQVFEHLADPLAAARALYNATAPGGVVVWTGPQQAQFHQVPHDYYRYTIEGVKYSLVAAGFCVPNHAFAGGGDFVFDIARDAGLQIQDFPAEEIAAAYQVGYENVSHSAISIHCLAFKPPHAFCEDPTAGWSWLASQGIMA